jgi:FAD/FMN-containing dehydrogenase/Fe-S oxidoreductase
MMHAAESNAGSGRARKVGRAEAEALAEELRATIRGEVRFDRGSRALYASDGSNYRQLPIGVVLPRDVDDVVATVALCQRHDVPLLPRGGGTSLAGQSCNVAVVLDMSKYVNQILDLDPRRQRARVQPGVILDHLRNAAEAYHLTFGPDPSTHSQCTLGGMIGNNSCGVHSVMAGMTIANIQEMEILTYDGLRMCVGPTDEAELAHLIAAGGRKGEIYAALKTLSERYAHLIRTRFPQLPRRASGYALDQLLPENGFHVARALVGSEGTCVTVLEATTRLVASPPARCLLVLGYPDAYSAADHVMEVMAAGPIGLEGFDAQLVSNIRKKHLQAENTHLLPEGGGWLLAEFGGQNIEQASDQARQLQERLTQGPNPPAMQLLTHKEEAARIWAVREAALGATVFVPGEPEGWEGWEDAAVPPEKLGGYLRALRTLLQRYEYTTAIYGHFGQGCVHTRINFDLTSRDGIRTFRAFMEEAADLVVSFGGSLSGEHGDGQARGELLPRMYGEELVQAFREFKAIWDPAGRMNPGKLSDPYRLDENLRLGPRYNPPHLQTYFQFPHDEGHFANATLRCVGVGKCRRTEGGTMCPSFMVTREEMHTTRGRTRMLFEMLQGEVLHGGWRDRQVKEALDLCLACKACKSECPVNVDMATYKAEFLAHYYRGRLRPRSAYALGLIYRWARVAAHLPALVNRVTHTPGLQRLVRWLAGIAPERELPTFASPTFRQWFERRTSGISDGLQVLLWPDTFTNYFHPEVAIAAVEVLEAAGCQVMLPTITLCCGRPLYDYGMLPTAQRLLRHVLSVLEPQISAGVPLVGLEPSCVAVFRDELLNFFPHDEQARRLSKQTFLLSEFLVHRLPAYQPPRLQGRALVHGHCHQRALAGMKSELEILRRLGLQIELPEPGCCGMAGSFGFERAHYQLAMQCGERALLPAVRACAGETLLIANGFSCQEQIAQSTQRRPLHLAQVLQMALREGEQK